MLRKTLFLRRKARKRLPQRRQLVKHFTTRNNFTSNFPDLPVRFDPSTPRSLHEDELNAHGFVGLQVLPSTTHVLTGATNSVNVLAKVITGKPPKPIQRNPLNLSIVLDRSGSMHGQKLENAKSAILQVIKQLDDKDILNLIVYSDEVHTLFENKSCVASEHYNMLEKEVNQITSHRTTNLWGGLERGIQTIVKHKPEGYNHRVFLFSDGLVNVGITDDSTICRNVSDVYENHNIQVSAFGLGEDFDEKLMKSISERGVGAYYFIENAQSIPKFVDSALTFLQMTVGTNAVLKARGLNCGIMKKFYGEHDLIKGALLGDLRADNTRSIMMQVDVSPQRGSEGILQNILECELTYTRQINGVPKEFSIRREIPVILTENSHDVEKNMNMEVLVSSVLLNIVDLDKNLREALEAGNVQEAMNILQKEITILESIVEIDKNQLNNMNKVEKILSKTRTQLDNLKTQGITKIQIKEFHHREYAISRG